MLAWDHSGRSNSKLLYEIEDKGHETVALSGSALKECSQTLEIHGAHRFWKERPAWMQTVYSGKEGDNTALETVVNVVTSIPFVLIGLRVPRKSFSTTMYSNSLIGVGVASTLYHTSRGEARKGTRWGDYAMIATSTLCMSSAVQQDGKHSKALMLASLMMHPLQPRVVSAIDTGLAEATFARKVMENPKLRRAHSPPSSKLFLRSWVLRQEGRTIHYKTHLTQQ